MTPCSVHRARAHRLLAASQPGRAASHFQLSRGQRTLHDESSRYALRRFPTSCDRRVLLKADAKTFADRLKNPSFELFEVRFDFRACAEIDVPLAYLALDVTARQHGETGHWRAVRVLDGKRPTTGVYCEANVIGQPLKGPKSHWPGTHATTPALEWAWSDSADDHDPSGPFSSLGIRWKSAHSFQH
jgi:hypothetical protein